jgi:hypothetical protein
MPTMEPVIGISLDDSAHNKRRSAQSKLGLSGRRDRGTTIISRNERDDFRRRVSYVFAELQAGRLPSPGA